MDFGGADFEVDALQGAADAYTEKTGVKVDLVGKDVADIKDDAKRVEELSTRWIRKGLEDRVVHM